MSSRLYWALTGAVVALVLVGFVLVTPAPIPQVNGRVIEDFYQTKTVWAFLIGVAMGVGLGAWAIGHTYHRPADSGEEFAHRVAWRGFWVGLLAALVAGLFALAFAVLDPFPPYAPLDMPRFIVGSAAFLVLLGAAAAAAWLGFAVATRSRAWGGQYSLIKRF